MSDFHSGISMYGSALKKEVKPCAPTDREKVTGFLAKGEGQMQLGRLSGDLRAPFSSTL